MRPKSIVMFERVVIVSIVLGIINSFLIWDKMIATLEAQGASTGAMLPIQVVMTLLYLLLIWFIAHKASPVAKWIYVVLGVIGIVGAAIGIGQTIAYGTVPLILTVIQYALLIYSIWLLFRPDSKAWFSDGREETA